MRTDKILSENALVRLSYSNKDEKYWEKQEKLMHTMFNYVQPDLLKLRVASGQSEFTFEEANNILPIFKRLDYLSQLRVWDTYALTSAIYLVYDDPGLASRGVTPVYGAWVKQAQLGSLMRIIPSDEKYYGIFAKWCMSKCTKYPYNLPELERFEEDLKLHRRPKVFVKEWLERVCKDIDGQQYWADRSQEQSNRGVIGEYLIPMEYYRASLFMEGVIDYDRNKIRPLSELEHQFHNVSVDDLSYLGWALWGYEAGLRAGRWRLYLEELLSHLEVGNGLANFEFSQEKYEKPFNEGAMGNVSTPSPALQLADIFYNHISFTEAIDALKLVNPPVIGINNNFLLPKREKGAIVAWIDVLAFRGKIRKIDHKTLSTLLSAFFVDFEIGERTLRAEPTVAYNYYKGEFSVLLKS